MYVCREREEGVFVVLCVCMCCFSKFFSNSKIKSDTSGFLSLLNKKGAGAG